MPTIEPERVALGVGAIAMVAALTNDTFAGDPLPLVGLLLVLLSAAGRLAYKRRPGSAPPWAGTAVSALGLALGCAAILAGRGVSLGNPFPAESQSLLGVPHHLAWLALVAAGLRLREAPHDARGRRLWLLSALWASIALLMPTRSGLSTALPIVALGSEHPALAIVLGLTTLLGLARALPWLTPIDVQPLDRLGAHVLWAPLSLGLWHLMNLSGEANTAAEWCALLALFAAGWALVHAGSLLLVQLANHSASSGPRGALGRAELVAPGCVIALFLLLKTHGMGASNTDENIYFYMASRIAEGQWPYVDYFFAHPPLHVLLPGAIFSVTGFHLTLAKAIAPLACAVSGAALWSLARRHLGWVAALVSLVGFLFAAEVLKGSTNMTGVNLTVMWMLLGLRAWLLEQPRRAGLFFAASLSTGIYAAAAVCAALALGVFRSRRFAGEMALATVIAFGLVNLVGWAVAPEAFIDGVYRYHGLKTPDAESYMPLFGGDVNPLSAWGNNLAVLLTGRPFIKELFYHAHLWVAGALLPWTLLARCLSEPRPTAALRRLAPQHLWTSGPTGRAALLWWVGVSLLAQFALFREVYSFYFVLIYPVLALCLGTVVASVISLLGSAVARSWPIRSAAVRLTAGVTLLVALLSWETIAYKAQASAFPKEVAATGEVVQYTWKPAPVLGSLSPIVRHLFWADQRQRGVMERGYRHYLWNKKRALASLPEIASFVRARSSDADTIAGSSTVAPLIALASGRRLAADEADTNTKRFRTGVLDEASYWDAICRDNVRFIVSAPRSFFTTRRLQRHRVVQRWFRPVKRFEDPEIRHGGTYPIVLFERTRSDPVNGRVCE